jgi:hypothetical protein
VERHRMRTPNESPARAIDTNLSSRMPGAAVEKLIASAGAFQLMGRGGLARHVVRVWSLLFDSQAEIIPLAIVGATLPDFSVHKTLAPLQVLRAEASPTHLLRRATQRDHARVEQYGW